MAGKSALPLLLVAGGAALLLSGKKKKKTGKSKGGSSSPGTDGGLADEDPGEDYTEEDYIEDADPYEAPLPADKPKGSSRPKKNPPRGKSYDGAYWGANVQEGMINIRQHFKDLGYPVEVIEYPMSILGPKGTLELESTDGTMGRLGGYDDKPNEIVRGFQRDYNNISRLNVAEKIYPVNMGGLEPDGLVGPYTLNGLRTAKEHLPGGKTWSDLTLQASNKGFA